MKKSLFSKISLIIILFNLIKVSQASKVTHSTIEDNFAHENTEFDKKSTETFLGYEFIHDKLLYQALFPLLPRRLQGSTSKDYKKNENAYDNLEFLGDGVLGLCIRKFIVGTVGLLTDDRGFNNLWYAELVRNNYLTEIYVTKLKEIEKFIPYPGPRKYQACNIIEAIIGAIFLDNPEKSSQNSKNFIYRLTSYEELIQSIEKVYIGREKPRPPHLKDKNACKNFIHSKLKKHIERKLELHFSKIDPEEFLKEIYGLFFSESPVYNFLEMDIKNYGKKHVPLFKTLLMESNGMILIGEGVTQKQANENAARNLINILAKKEVFPTVLKGVDPDYRTWVENFCNKAKFTIKRKCYVYKKPYYSFMIKNSLEEEIINLSGMGYIETDDNKYSLDDTHHYKELFNELIKTEEIKRILLENSTLEENNNLTVSPEILEKFSVAIEKNIISIFSNLNGKDFLKDTLYRAYRAYPTYSLSGLDVKTDNISNKDMPLFKMRIMGPEIGMNLIGEGVTQEDAEENAARNAINTYFSKEIFSLISLNPENRLPDYINWVKYYCSYHKFQIIEFSENDISILKIEDNSGKEIEKHEFIEGSKEKAFEEIFHKLILINKNIKADEELKAVPLPALVDIPDSSLLSSKKTSEPKRRITISPQLLKDSSEKVETTGYEGETFDKYAY